MGDEKVPYEARVDAGFRQPLDRHRSNVEQQRLAIDKNQDARSAFVLYREPGADPKQHSVHAGPETVR